MWFSVLRVVRPKSSQNYLLPYQVAYLFSSSAEGGAVSSPGSKASKQPSFFKSLKLHSGLAASLRQNKITEPTQIQEKSLHRLIEGENAVITSETGSGKTLCYLVPIINDILQMKLSNTEVEHGAPRGAIILVPTKELGAQVYAMIRRLDTNNLILVARQGSISHISPLPTKEKVKAEEDITTNEQKQNTTATATTGSKKKEKVQLSYDNISRSINWNEQDVLVATPTQLEPILQLKDKTNPYDVDPKTIVLDEFDLLLGDTNVAKSTVAILNRFANLQKNPMNEMRQFILTAASLPKKINREDTSTFLSRVLRKPLWFESDQFYKISDKMDHVVINVSAYLASNNQLTEPDILFNVIKKSTSKRIIVFTASSETSLQVASFLNHAGIAAVAFHAKLPAEDRLEALKALEDNRVRVLVSTDLGCRGLDFQKVDHVIQFDFALDAVSFLHRVGRTCRMGSAGTVTSFVRQQDVFFYSKVKAVLDAKNRMDPIVSRKRSLSKAEIRTSKSEEDEQEIEDGEEEEESEVSEQEETKGSNQIEELNQDVDEKKTRGRKRPSSFKQ